MLSDRHSPKAKLQRQRRTSETFEIIARHRSRYGSTYIKIWLPFTVLLDSTHARPPDVIQRERSGGPFEARLIVREFRVRSAKLIIALIKW